MSAIFDFVRQSNGIEGILRSPTKIEIDAHRAILACSKIRVDDLIGFVAAISPGKLLRSKPGMNVSVADHCAPIGGREIGDSLANILRNLQPGMPPETCYTVHVQYERLHPFMDGNGRSGRVLWLWMMGGLAAAPLGFLHHWYYQSLAGSRL